MDGRSFLAVSCAASATLALFSGEYFSAMLLSGIGVAAMIWLGASK